MMLENMHYTFMYCVEHHHGCMVQGWHKTIPDGFKLLNSPHSNDTHRWVSMGVIYYTHYLNDAEIPDDVPSVAIVQTTKITYDSYEGSDFKFHHYREYVTNEKGQELYLDEETPLYKWFDDISD
jgi:hypothetical protein